MSNEIMRRELKEAIDAGERALSSLYLAQERLGSARNWGIFDILGGGFFASMIKHSKIDDATSYMEDAKYNLQRFQRELQDINVPANLKMEIGSFLSFADFFFDGFISDYLVQTKIEDARGQVEDAIRMVEGILFNLKSQYEIE